MTLLSNDNFIFPGFVGIKSIEIHNGDLTDCGLIFDTLVVSAFKGDYYPVPGTLLGALKTQFGLDMWPLAQFPLIDLREDLGVWAAEVPAGLPFRYLVCVEMVDHFNFRYADAFNLPFKHLAAILAAMPYYGAEPHRIAMPLLGAGNQNLPVPLLVPAAMQGLQMILKHNFAVDKIYIVEKNPQTADEIKLGMGEYLVQKGLKSIEVRQNGGIWLQSGQAGEQEIKLAALEKALYIFLLNRPEGVAKNYLSNGNKQAINEIDNIYQVLPTAQLKGKKEYVKTLIENPKRMHQTVSKANKKIAEAIPAFALSYIIDSGINAYKVPVPPNLLTISPNFRQKKQTT